MSKPKGKSFWFKETPGGDRKLRTSRKVLFGMLLLLVPALFYLLLISIEGLQSGPRLIVMLAYGIIVLVTVAMLLVIVVSLIDYLRRFE